MRAALLGVLLAVFFAVAILDDGSGDGSPPDPTPPVEPDV